MTLDFGIVCITKLYDRNWRYTCDNVEGYMEQSNTTPDMVENIGEFKQQIKPVFDIDAYVNDIDVDIIKKEINTIFPDKK